jgi:outer membrane protein OmpA-like peptidoglycan-associated protein
MSLMESITGVFSPSLLQQIASKTGVQSSAIHSGVGGIAATLVDGLASKSDDSHAMNAVSDLVHESPNESEDFDRLVQDEDSPMRRRGSKLLGLATSDPSGMVRRIGGMFGIGGPSASGLLGMVSGLVMAGFRRFGRGTHVDGASLASTLRSERSSFRELMPKSLQGAPTAVHGFEQAAPRPHEVVHHRGRAWWVLIPIALLVIWGLSRIGHRREPEVRRPTAARRYENRERPMTPTTPSAAENRLMSAITSPSAAATWIGLDQVSFNTGSAALEPSADAQITRVATLLREHPDARVEVAGAPDTGGAPQPNAALGQARADSVRTALIAKGIDGSRITATSRGGEGAQGAVGAQPTAAIRIVP